MQASVGVKPTRYLSGPTAALDPHWDFGQAGVKPVRVLLQVRGRHTNTHTDMSGAQADMPCQAAHVSTGITPAWSVCGG